MRSQFYPLALCLFMAFLAHSTVFSSTDRSADKSLLSLDFKAVVLKSKEHNKSGKTIKVETPDIKEIPAKSEKNAVNSKSDSKTQKFKFEENSYNFASSSDASSVRNPQKDINTPAAATQDELSASFGDGLFYGFAIMVVLLNLICYFLFDEKVFLLYSLALVSIVNLLFFSDGLLPLLGVVGLNDSYVTEATLVLINCVFAAWFASKYLIVPELFPKLRFISFLGFGISAIFVLLSWSAIEPIFAAISNTISFAVVSLHFIAGMYLFSRKNYPKFYVIAFSIPLLFAVDYFVMRNFGFEFLMTEPIHLKAAVLVEMLLITYAIMYRMRAIKEEHELRQTELRIFLKRQEMMNRKSAMQLMEDVYLENLIMHYDLDGFEIKLLQYISEGKDNAKIARKLKTTETEIEELTKELYHKLEISEHIQEDYRMVDAQADYIYN